MPYPWTAGDKLDASDLNNMYVPIGAVLGWLKSFAQRSTGTADNDLEDKLEDSGADFVTDGVAVGDIVENEDDNTFGYVTAVDSATVLSLDSDVFPDGDEGYKVWKTPRLPVGWVECNGQAISDANSKYNGVSTPDLNTTQRFLRGNKRSGATGGSDTHVLSEAEMPAHSHTIDTREVGAGAGVSGSAGAARDIVNTGSKGSGNAHENKPAYYEVVWIMRVK